MADSVADENRPPDKGDEEDGQAMSVHGAASHLNSSESGDAKSKINDKRLQSEKLGHRRVKGDVITYKKTPTNMLMLSIQLGLEQSIGKITNKPKRDLLMLHFSEKEDVDFAPEGSVQTLAHSYGFFKFKTYAPLAFRHFREDFEIKADDFLISLCNDQLRELSNPGASGSVFYLTNDDEFIIKTVDHKEAKFLRHLLPGYYMNLIQNKRTLLPKFYGLYTYTNNFAGNIRIVVMNNLLPSGIRYHEKYDLKGSTFKRLASDKELAKKSPTLKDLDFRRLHPEGYFVASDKYASVMESMKRDTTVLESFKIMDYSLLMGVHNIDEELRSRGYTSEGASPEHTLSDRPGSMGEGSAPTRRQFFSVVQERGHEEVEALPYTIPDGGISARNAKGDRLVVYIGIIDILQNYRFRKKIEHSFKSIVHEGDTVSVHKPGFYAQRFTEFFSKFVFHPKAIVRRRVSSVRRARQASAPVSPTSPVERPIVGAGTGYPAVHVEQDAVAASAEPELPEPTSSTGAAADDQPPTTGENAAGDAREPSQAGTNKIVTQVSECASADVDPGPAEATPVVAAEVPEPVPEEAPQTAGEELEGAATSPSPPPPAVESEPVAAAAPAAAAAAAAAAEVVVVDPAPDAPVSAQSGEPTADAAPERDGSESVPVPAANADEPPPVVSAVLEMGPAAEESES